MLNLIIHKAGGYEIVIEVPAAMLGTVYTFTLSLYATRGTHVLSMDAVRVRNGAAVHLMPILGTMAGMVLPGRAAASFPSLGADTGTRNGNCMSAAADSTGNMDGQSCERYCSKSMRLPTLTRCSKLAGGSSTKCSTVCEPMTHYCCTPGQCRRTTVSLARLDSGAVTVAPMDVPRSDLNTVDAATATGDAVADLLHRARCHVPTRARTHKHTHTGTR